MRPVPQQYTYAYGAVRFLPPYSPELNPQEHIWDGLREKYFHNRAFESIDALENHLVAALNNLENAPALIKNIPGWDWIINAAFNANKNKVSQNREVARRYDKLKRNFESKGLPWHVDISDALSM